MLKPGKLYRLMDDIGRNLWMKPTYNEPDSELYSIDLNEIVMYIETIDHFNYLRTIHKVIYKDKVGYIHNATFEEVKC